MACTCELVLTGACTPARPPAGWVCSKAPLPLKRTKAVTVPLAFFMLSLSTCLTASGSSAAWAVVPRAARGLSAMLRVSSPLPIRRRCDRPRGFGEAVCVTVLLCLAPGVFLGGLWCCSGGFQLNLNTLDVN